MNELYRTYEVLIEETVPDGHEKHATDRTKKPLRWNEEVDGALRDTHMVFQDAVCYYTLLLAGLAGNEKVADSAAPEKQVLLNPLWGHLTGALTAETEKAIRRLTANYKFPSGIKTAQDFLEKIYTWPETKEKRSELRNLLSRVYLLLESAGIDKDKETGQPKKLKAMADFASDWIRPLSDPTTNQADSTQGLRNENYFAARKLELKPENGLPADDASLSSAIELKHCFMTSKVELAGEQALCDYLAAFGCESGGKKPTTIGKIEGDVLLARDSLIAAWGEFPKTPKDATKEQKQLFKAKQVQWQEKAKTFPLKSWSGKKPNQRLWFCLRYKWAKNEATRNALYELIKDCKPHQLADGQTNEINQWRNLLPKGCVPFPFFTTQLGSATFWDFEFDKVALATAAEDVFKYKIRTLERDKKVRKLRNLISAYQASGINGLAEEFSPTGKPIEKIRGMEGDARWKGEQQNGNKGIEELLAEMKRTKELDDYGLREGTIGGWAELRKRLVDVHQKATKAGKGQSELCIELEEAVDAEQTANRQGFGSADFFHKLCEPAYHHLWLPEGEHNGIKDFIPHYVAYSEWKEELRDLLEEKPVNDNESDDATIEESEPRTKPISYTWPGLLNRHGEPSYRYYDFKTKLNETLTLQKLFRRVRPAGGGTPSYALIENQTVKIAARRLKRDKVMTLNGTSIDALWCPPLILQGNEQPSTKTQPRAGKSKDEKWPKGDMEVSFSLIARPLPKDDWNEVSGVPSELEIHPVHLKVSVPIEQEQQAKLLNDSLHWAKGSLKGFDEDDDKRKHFRWPIDIEASKAQANKNKEEKVSADKLWCGKGSGEFKGFTAKQSKFSKDGDTKYIADFHILSVDLGNRFAGAFSRLRIHADDAGGVRLISGEDFCPKVWADTIRTGTFRLRGEGADVWQIVTAKNYVHLEKQLKQKVGPTGSFVFAEEPYGSDGRGRYPDVAETERFQKLADKLVRKDACSLAGTEKMTYPELGDHLVFRLKRHIGRLRTLLNLLWRVCGDKEKDRKGEYTKPRDDEKRLFHRQLVVETLARGAYPKRPRLNDEKEDAKDESLRQSLASQDQWDKLKGDGLLESAKGKDEEQRLAELQKRIANWNWNALSAALKTQIKEYFEGDETTAKLLVGVVEFCLPLRGRHWKWDRSRKDRLFWGDNDSEWKPKIQGMRGLSLKRLEQVLNLRQRCQSFAKLEDRFVKKFAKGHWNPLPPMRRDEADDPCALLLNKSNELRYQRVDQIAHMILAEALGLELKNPAEVANKTVRKNEVDLHGEYKPRLGKNGEPLPRCSVIVLENLERYRTSQERTRQENSRLMKWAHRAILEKLEDICAPFGVTIMLVDPAFSSRFDSRNGLPGVRVNSVSKDFDKQMPYAAWVQQKDKNGNPTKLAQNIVTVAKLFEDNPNYKDQLIIAVEGGKEFLSVSGTEKDKLNADINAAVNIGLRAVADPRRWDIFPRLRTKQIGDGEVQVLNWRGVFGRFGKDDEKRRLTTSSALKTGGNVTTESDNVTTSGTKQKKHQKTNQDRANAAGISNDVESSTQSSEFPPFFVQAVDFLGIPKDEAFQAKSNELPSIRAYHQGLFLKCVERLCNERIQQINDARLKK